MSTFEKKISFLNRYFVYKKVREVNVDKIQLELGEYEEAVVQRERESTKQAISVAKEVEEKAVKPKVKKLSKKLELIPATEAIEEPSMAKVVEQAIQLEEEKAEPLPQPVRKPRKPRAPKEPKEPKEPPKTTKKPKVAKQTKTILIVEDDE
jgi:hypothetical protein